MKRSVRIVLTAGLLGTLLMGCSKPPLSNKGAEAPQRILTVEEMQELNKQAGASNPSGTPNRAPAPPGGAGRPAQPAGPKVNSPAPETVSQDLDGKEVKLSDLKGKVVVLDFWATWCGPCRNMIPHTAKLHEKMKGKPLVIVSVSSDSQKEALTNFLKTTKMPWTHWWDGQRKLSALYGISGIPTVYVVDHKGIIRHHQVGFGGNSHDLDTMVEKLVKEAEDSTKKGGV
jgi:thiol-disulfide isomerase/thioredoxin